MDDVGKIIVLTTQNGDKYFNIVSETGKILASSETHNSEESLLKSIRSINNIFSGQLVIEGLESI